MSFLSKLFRSDAATSVAITKTQRQDGWLNASTGMGTSRDKTQNAFFWTDIRIPDPELVALFNGDDIAARIVERRPTDMMRRGYEVSLKDGEADALDAVYACVRALKVDAKIREAIIWGRLFGGALLIPGIVDGQNPDMPLNEKRVKAIKFLTVVDRRYVQVRRYYSNPLEDNFGKPEVYFIVDPTTGVSVEIHESRTIRFEGPMADAVTRRSFNSWTLSVLQRPYDIMKKFAATYQGAGILLSDASQAVFTIRGLIDQIAAGPEVLQTRMELTDMMRSAGRAILVDAEGESFQRQATSFAGIPEMIDRFMSRLAAAADMPVTLLMGQSPAGMNATGESDTRGYYDSVANEQQTVLLPALERMYRILSLANGVDPDKVEITFNPLWEPTDLEKATAEKMVADRDAVYITAGVWLPEEVALARSKGLMSTAQTEIDEESRQASLDATVDMTIEDPMGMKAAMTEPQPGTDPEAEDDGEDPADETDTNETVSGE